VHRRESLLENLINADATTNQKRAAKLTEKSFGMTQLPTYRTLDEASVILRTHQRTLRRYIKAGKIPFVRIGRKYLFRESDLMSLPATQRATRESILT
jgi:excisionase family DNA binding protein